MSRSGLARAECRAHQEREVARGGLDQELLVHVLKASHVKTIQSAAVELMCEVPLDPLASLPLQPLATFALNAPPIAVHRFLLGLFAIPVAGSAIWLGYVSSHFDPVQSNHHIVAVIALVRHHFLYASRMHFILTFRRRLCDQSSHCNAGF